MLARHEHSNKSVVWYRMCRGREDTVKKADQ